MGLNENEKVFLLDLDGVLADYAEGFSRFFNLMMGTDYKPSDMWYHKFKRNFKVSDKVYEDLKDAYRKFRFKTTLKPIEGYKEFFRKYKDSLIYIWTSRSTRKYPINLFNTVEWLDKFGIKHDSVYFVDNFHCDKIDFLEKRIPKNLKNNMVLVDDDGEIKYFEPYVKEVVLFDQPYNQKVVEVRRIKSLKEL